MRNRRTRVPDGEPRIHTNCWVLKLEKASGEAGYFFGIGDGIIVLKSLDGKAQRFASKEDAERCARRLEKQFGLDIEEATPEEVVHDQTFELWLANGDPPTESQSTSRRERASATCLFATTARRLPVTIWTTMSRTLSCGFLQSSNISCEQKKVSGAHDCRDGCRPKGKRKMSTSLDNGLAFCLALHERISADLVDAAAVHGRVESLLPRNSFHESCFCKGLVLPIVDSLATDFLKNRYRASRADVHQALRCEGFDTPLYQCDASQVGFSSHSRSNSYHPGDKSGRRASTRRSPDLCIRLASSFRMVGELKYLERARPADTSRVVGELRNYLAIAGESTSDWGHDFGFGLIYEFGGGRSRHVEAVDKWWESDRIFLTTITRQSE